MSHADGDIDTLAQANRQELIELKAERMLKGQQGTTSADNVYTLSMSERHLLLLERQVQLQEKQAERQRREQQYQ